MSPPVASSESPQPFGLSVIEQKKAGLAEISQANLDVNENYEGKYKFAPIQEAQVSRAMIKRFVPLYSGSIVGNVTALLHRYFESMYENVISDVVIVGAGSAGLSCAYQLAKSAPHLKITIIEAGVAPGGGGCLATICSSFAYTTS